MSVDKDWLISQLPRAMAQDPVLNRFVTAFQEVADTVRDRVDGIEHQVDTGLASPEMLAYLASWLGLQLEPTDSAEYQRDLLRQAGKLLGWRGTRHGVEGLLGAATGARVEVSDSGGVFGQKDTIPPPDNTVTVQLDHTGHLSERQVRAILEQEVPLGANIVLDVRYPSDGTGGGRRGR
ncbi:phage tail protein [Virgisporangium aliadipatigenens]|uniref:Phage tail protein n=1 Tax=Virgisporangium aliadipatigenens TaxID=741659 RepID=A0A8J3YDN3_9ACTN|nr:phage tail protein [Virgisporangium aliadipatigenens]GIJ43214.1 phage tail protein [Virgisporangium aliadipatigenens]